MRACVCVCIQASSVRHMHRRDVGNFSRTFIFDFSPIVIHAAFAGGAHLACAAAHNRCGLRPPRLLYHEVLDRCDHAVVIHLFGAAFDRSPGVHGKSSASVKASTVALLLLLILLNRGETQSHQSASSLVSISRAHFACPRCTGGFVRTPLVHAIVELSVLCLCVLRPAAQRRVIQMCVWELYALGKRALSPSQSSPTRCFISCVFTHTHTHK